MSISGGATQNTAISQAEAHVEQLRIQADIDRMKVSESSKE